MSVRNLKDGNKKPWLCECYPQGRSGKRIRKRFATKGEGLAYERHIMVDQPWNKEPQDERTLLDMIDIWHKNHGSTLSDALRTYERLKLIVMALGNPEYKDLTASDYLNYRAKRLSGELPEYFKNSITATTCNTEYAIFNSVINELIRTEYWDGENPLKTVRKIKVHEKEMLYLSIDEIKQLLDNAYHDDHDIYKLIKLSLATGGRFGETSNLTSERLTKFKVTFSNTKGKKNRTVPISEELYHEVYTGKSGKLFDADYWHIRSCMVRYLPRLKNKDTQIFHILRHTFASYYMMNGGNILILQHILGHSSITDTMKYAHFAPDYLEDAVSKNPLTNL